MARDLFQEAGVDLLDGQSQPQSGQPRDLLLEKETKNSPGPVMSFINTISEYADKFKPQNILDSIKGQIPGLAGGLAGGAASTATKRIPLTGLLAAGGEGYHQIYQQVTGSPDAPKTSLEAAKRLLITGGEQAVGQAGGELITKGVSKLIPHIKKQFLVPGLEDAEKEIRLFMEPHLVKPMPSKGGAQGPGFTVAQKSEPFSGASKMENIIESSFFGATPIKQFKYAQEKAIEDYAKTLTDNIWQGAGKATPSEIGTNLRAAYEKAYGAFNDHAKDLYGQLDKLASSVKVPQAKTTISPILDQSGKPIQSTKTVMTDEIVDMRPLKKWASGLLEEYKSKAGIGSSQMGDTLLGKLTGLPDSVSFSEAQKIRTGLRLEKQSFESRDIARGLATQGEKLTNVAMDKAAELLPANGKALWKETNYFYRKGMETLDNEFIYKIAQTAKEQPELVGRQLFQNGEITQIKQIKEVLMPSKDNPLSQYVFSDPRTWQNMKAGYLESVFTKATDPKTGAISSSQIANFLSGKSGGVGTETLREIFSTEELKALKTFSIALTTIEKKAPTSGGSMLIQLMQAPALAGAVTAYGGFKKDPEIIAGGLTLLATPRILGKMIVSPRYHDLFMNGLSSSKPIALPAITKLAIAAYDMRRELQSKTESEKPIEKQPMPGKSLSPSTTSYGLMIGGS
ncbi:MAG: hypothetical protein L7F78_09270 [Syntrophales bacterium LBB04]|nr:hypothetical protein [Syntrophales bacterium LBB04]